ncbi:hypothetical protein G7074_00580 [Pedobacter sp. HDW13]|uniref:hypothetical protein n=1 Tax=Pedobacter sp. HDW13 TaxID=2714940 RepID=UPI00140AA7A9|nr:hypothetical protein [Pedobacter sp. HDW13]QIL37909.1 hypothetical protein G7074_00580 [Pedobacter sp. HDW13]
MGFVVLIIMVLNKRMIDRRQLIEKIEAIRLIKQQYIYHTYLEELAGKNCELCALPLNPYGIYLNNKQAICIQCFNDYINTKDYLDNLEIFETRVSRTNKLADNFSASLKTYGQNIDIDLINKLFKDLSLAEIEQMVGFPKSFGSFDYGIEAGRWKLENLLVEIWFKKQVCTKVTLI